MDETKVMHVELGLELLSIFIVICTYKMKVQNNLNEKQINLIVDLLIYESFSH